MSSPRPAGIDPALYPFAPHYHRLASGPRMHYVDEGPADAPPVVMVHGNPTWSFYWRELIKGLGDGFRRLAPDHVGMGLSDRPDDAEYDYTLARRVADFGEWIDAVAPDRPVDLVVHDWGGAIGMSWAAAHHERVRRIVITNTWAFTIPDEVGLPAALKFARTPIGAFLVRRFNAFSGLAVKMATSRTLPPAVARGLVAPYRGGPEQRLATLRFVQDIPLSPEDPAWQVLDETERRLPALAGKPVQILWGGRDFVFNDLVLERWKDVFPAAQVQRFDDAHHYVMEDAAERIVPKVRAFLSD